MAPLLLILEWLGEEDGGF